MSSTSIGSTSPTITLFDATDAAWYTPATSTTPAIARVLRFKRRDSNGSGTVTLVPRVTGQTIDGATSKTVAVGAFGGVVSDGANLLLI